MPSICIGLGNKLLLPMKNGIQLGFVLLKLLTACKHLMSISILFFIRYKWVMLVWSIIILDHTSPNLGIG